MSSVSATISRPLSSTLLGNRPAPACRRGPSISAPEDASAGWCPYARGVDCPSCGKPVPEGARFCPSCGQALQPPRSDERRVATVLFADLVGFTTLSESP